MVVPNRFTLSLAGSLQLALINSHAHEQMARSLAFIISLSRDFRHFSFHSEGQIRRRKVMPGGPKPKTSFNRLCNQSINQSSKGVYDGEFSCRLAILISLGMTLITKSSNRLIFLWSLGKRN